MNILPPPETFEACIVTAKLLATLIFSQPISETLPPQTQQIYDTKVYEIKCNNSFKYIIDNPLSITTEYIEVEIFQENNELFVKEKL